MGNIGDFSCHTRRSRNRRRVRDIRLQPFGLTASILTGFRILFEAIFDGFSTPQHRCDYIFKPYGYNPVLPMVNQPATYEIAGLTAQFEVTYGLLMSTSLSVGNNEIGPNTQFKTRYALGTCTSIKLETLPNLEPDSEGFLSLSFERISNSPKQNGDVKEIPTFEEVDRRQFSTTGSIFETLSLVVNFPEAGTNLIHYSDWDRVLGVVTLAYKPMIRGNFLDFHPRNVDPTLTITGTVIVDGILPTKMAFNGSVRDLLKDSAVSIRSSNTTRTYMMEGFKILDEEDFLISGNFEDICHHGGEEEVLGLALH